ncbi:UDP-glucose 4-epimerase protein [Candidatus Micropelagos thuwalensis]|uniref:UDP-glucose 4-epimerase protein n=1 Tax=Candidatus Micropelagius thuwalensis TaxID=1397666 RepID=U2XW17_9PROT|nr:hypothetical protein [Candidatus Micropelagos thuwalensis]ERL47021.1 UDP-glucose 4-epimerase protein [Candidatus Micropelagos thuwalensis]
MKPLLLIIALLFSTPAWAEWEIMVEGKEGDTFRVGFEPTLIEDRYILYYVLHEFIDKDSGSKSFSDVEYYYGRCGLFMTRAAGATPLSRHKINGEIVYVTVYESYAFRPTPNTIEAIILQKSM